MATRGSIFRDQALEHHKRRRDKTSLPHFMPFPVTFLLWFLLAFLLVMGALAWNEQIPLYIHVPGVVLDAHSTMGTKNQAGGAPIAAIFLPADQLAKIHPGQSADIQFGTGQSQFQSNVIKIESGMLSPNTLHQRYGVRQDVVTQPAAVVLVQIKGTVAASAMGSLVMATVQTGSQRIIALLPGLGSLVGA
ncbi:hypothetical protein [Dictyobacter arantiisoli]|uniref:Uncharacterized protein n=1 Tax=Dictyobacter arantiisoli TaxID=2014874 RepID=A0A5A5T7F2_9CHLR|nr:hypothetical protein [Dictyobacter arantiisoli]GCF06933.1 hypothetical protein KDI_04970 [Dictyobacter arantiisoli]